jgi:hypothetical protein
MKSVCTSFALFFFYSFFFLCPSSPSSLSFVSSQVCSSDGHLYSFQINPFLGPTSWTTSEGLVGGFAPINGCVPYFATITSACKSFFLRFLLSNPSPPPSLCFPSLVPSFLPFLTLILQDENDLIRLLIPTAQVSAWIVSCASHLLILFSHLSTLFSRFVFRFPSVSNPSSSSSSSRARNVRLYSATPPFTGWVVQKMGLL